VAEAAEAVALLHSFNGGLHPETKAPSC